MGNLNNFAFIDSQNLNLGTLDDGWKLDMKLFRRYLRDKYKVSKAFLFIGYIDHNIKLYDFLNRSGYTLIFKNVIKFKGKAKGNVDAELVLHCMIHVNKFDKAIIVTNDGDFYCLVEYLDSIGKLMRILVPNRKFSSLFRKKNKYISRLDKLKDKLQLKKDQDQRSDESLGCLTWSS